MRTWVLLLVYAVAVGIAAAPRPAAASGVPWIAAYASEPTVESVLTLPQGDFYYALAEMAGMRLANPEHSHAYNLDMPHLMAPREDDSDSSTEPSMLACDVADLREALDKSGMPEADARALIAAYSNAREDLFEVQLSEQRPNAYRLDDQGNWVRDRQAVPVPKLEWDEARLRQLPREFALYLSGARAWWQAGGEPAGRARAVAAWQELLALPPTERHYRSVWAAHMIARATLPPSDWEKRMATGDTTATRAATERTRGLSGQGFADPLGLAAESSGILGRLDLDEGRFVEALHDYFAMLRASRSLRQRHAALLSLRTAVTHAVDSPAAARDPLACHLVSLYVASEHDPGTPWLAVVRAANADPTSDTAALLAWVAYDAGDLAYAREMLRRAPEDSARSRWVRAKLLLYDGKVEEGTRLLTEVAGALPHTSPVDGPEYEMGLGLNGSYADGERGLLLLGRSDYLGAFDAFVKAHSWGDVGYLADRVLTPRELERYLAQHAGASYLGVSALQPSLPEHESDFDARIELTVDQSLHYILARRLARAGQYEKALPHMPEAWRPYLRAYAKHRDAAADDLQPRRARALHFFAAAWIARYCGMEILGTEEEPDWKAFEGRYDEEGPVTNRVPSKKPTTTEEPASIARLADDTSTNTRWLLGASSQLHAALRPTQDELDRVAASAPSPNVRFHYRFVAAELGWKAARLLPDNDPVLPYVLWRSGMWINQRDDKYADKFYQALVSRCRKFPISAAADRILWFPAEGPPLPDEVAKMIDPKLAAERSKE